MNLTVNVLANLSGFMSGMTQIRQVVQQTGQQLQAGLLLPPAATNSLQTFRERAMQVAFAVGAISAGLTAMAGASVAAFARQEQAFAGIQKTVDATDAEFAQLRANLTALSNRAPISFSDLSRIGELAGQLGIRGVENLTKFTDTIAKISVTTNLTAEAAATSFARIANVMQEPIENVDRMGATVVDLGNKFATTEAEITEFAQRIAGAGKIAGLTTADVFAIGTAFSSVGVQAEAGGTAIQKMLVAMTQSVAAGGEKLRVFAATAGVTEQEFQKLFRTAPAQAFTKVIEGLALAGEEAFDILGAIVGEEARFLRAMLSMSNAGDLLSRAFKTAGTAWEQNLALVIESEKRFATFTSTMQTLRNVMENFAASLGEQLMPFLRPLAVGITALITAFQALPGPVKAFIAISISLAAVVGGIVTAIALAVAAFTALAGAIGGAVVLLKIGAWVAAAIVALAALGTAVQAVVKFFGFFSETTNQLEARLRGQAGAVQANASVWKQFGTQVSEVWLGLKVVAGEALGGILSGVREGLAGVLATIAGWGSAIREAWAGIWTDIKATFTGLWSLIPEEVKTGVAQILALLNPLKGAFEGVAAAWNYLRARGQQALEAERTRQRELDNELKREIARGNAMREATEKTFKGAGLSVEEFDAKLRKLQLTHQDLAMGFQISSAAIKLAVTSGVLTEDEALRASLEVLDLREAALKRQYQAELALVGGMSKYAKERAEKEDDINKRFKAGTADILNARMDLIDRITAAHIKQTNQSILFWQREADAAVEATNKIGEERVKLHNQLIETGQTEFERFVAQERERAAAEASALEAGGAPLDVVLKRYELMHQRIQEHLTKGAAQAQRELGGLAASVGLTGEAAFKAQQAFVLYGKAYKDLDDAQRKNVDTNAQALAQLDEITKKTQAYALVHAALLTGYGKEITLTQALNAASIKLREQQLASVLDYYKTVNNAAQNELRLQAEIDQEIAQNKRDLYGFLTATTRRWVADQENIWKGFGRLITGVFDQMQRSLSDVFFNLFTGQTVKLKDVWKSMLDAMLRELANFLATQTVRTFLSFVGNLLQGQSVGTAASGALGGLLGGTGSTASGTSTATGVVNLVGTAATGISGLVKSLLGDSGSSGSLSSGLDFYGGLGSEYYEAGGGYYMAGGGRVPGAGSGDTVPAMLTPGEFVVRREVAQGIEPLLTLLNGGGAPTLAGGRLHFQTGGTVMPSISGDQAIVNLLYAILQQQAATRAATQATATNTGATAAALGEVPATASTAGITTLSGTGGNVQAGTAPAGSSPVRADGGGGSDLAALLGLTRTGLGTGRSLFNLGASGAGLSPSTIQGINSAISLLSGGIGLYQGISGGSVLGSLGGALQVGSGLTGLATAGGLIGSTTGMYLGGALGGIGGALGLYQGIESGNTLQSVLSAYQIYAAIAPIINAAAGTTVLPTVGSLAGSAFSAITGTTVSAGLAAAEAAGTLGAGVAAGGATAAAAGSGAAYATLGVGATAAIVLAPLAIGVIVDTILKFQEQAALENEIFQAKKDLRTVIPSAIEGVQNAAPTWDIINNPASTPQQIRAAFDRARSAVEAYNVYDFAFKSGSIGPLEVPQLATIGRQLAPILAILELGMLRATDRLAGTGLEPTGQFSTSVISLANEFGLNAKGNFAVTMTPEMQNWLVSHPEYQRFTETPYGTFQSGPYAQALATVKPGQLEQALFALANLYGAVPAQYAALGFGTAGGAPLALEAAPTIPLAVIQSIAAQVAASEQEAADALWNVSPGGLQHGGWVPGSGFGDRVPMMLEPGEFVVPRRSAIQYAPWLETLRAGQSGGLVGPPPSMPITINITVNGDVDDPEELAARLAPILRDELRRIDTRYSRAGNKTQV